MCPDAGAYTARVISSLQALVLGLVQGLTEFLPISSSAHLILLPRFLDWPDQGLAFDIAANTGTLVAVIFYFRDDLLGLVRRGLRGSGGDLLLWLVVASVPLGVAGLVLREFVETTGRSPLLIASTTLLFGVLLGIADWRAGRASRPRTDVSELGLRDALFLGGLQALALIPGTSRSGVTMTGGLFAGMSRELAARASFLMAIPAGGMVAVKDLIGLSTGAFERSELLPLTIVFVVSAVTGWCVIALLLAWLRQRSMAVFVGYRLVLAVVLFAVFARA